MTRPQNNNFFKLLIISILCCPVIVLGQESLEPVSSNPVLNQVKRSLSAQIDSIPVALPFFDDFSYASDTGFYPGSLWADKKVYVNNTYAIDPLSIGVATFDALDEDGKIYVKAEKNINTGADTLTSKFIDLKRFSPADSLYLSFYYQAAGYGERPEINDSLYLQFKSSKSKSWKTVWSCKGMADDDAIKPFKPVMLKLEDSVWFDTLFQFHFINTVSVNISNNAAGMNTNGDIWNIDYVYLSAHRSNADTAFNDIAIVDPVLPFLKRFSAMPWKHYLDYYHEVINDKFYVKLYNHNIDSAAVSDRITISEKGSSFDPIISTAYARPDTFSTFEEFCQIFTSDQEDSVTFQIKAQILADDTIKGNNTIYTYQNFSNYYAYDDGSAEYGYGLRGDNTTGAIVAYRMDGYKPDTLVAVDIFFNPSVNAANYTMFNLMLWDVNEKDSVPGDSLTGKNNCKIENISGFKHFIRFNLDTPKVIPTKFFIGWQQTNEIFLNVGYDRNRNATNYIYFNMEGTKNGWIQSKLQKKGALMIRPIYGSSITSKSQIINYEEVFTYPNPATNWMSLNFNETTIAASPTISILDLTGKTRIKQRLNSNIVNIQQLKSGIYIVKVQTQTGKVYSSKLIKQ